MIKLNKFFSQSFKSWVEVEEKIRHLPTAHERGEIFEQFVYLYLHLNKDYYQIKELYRLADLPDKYRKSLALENTDYGVDGVWVLEDGTFSAYQAKFRESRQSATVRELATFWAEASKANHKYIIANSVDLPKQADKHGYSILVDTLESLDELFFKQIIEIYSGQKVTPKQKFSPLKHQERMIGNIISGFEKDDRGKLIAACGAGKTLVALWSTEAMGAKNVLFLAPSLALIKQTLEAWVRHTNHKFSYLCVCSDKTVVSEVNPDSGDYEISEVDFPVTTDPEIVKTFLNSQSEHKYVFVTYNSAFVVSEALKGGSFGFDLGIFDEAHRTAGQKDTDMFAVALYDKGIKINKRLFMTATERLISPRIKRKAKKANRTIFSMDDKKVYGPQFDRYSFGEAIKDNVISDYKIILTAVNKKEVHNLIQDNALLLESGESTDNLVTAENIFKQIVLAKAMNKFKLNKAITFHSSIKRAKAFVQGYDSESANLNGLMVKVKPELESQKTYFDFVDGSMPAGVRKLKLKEFENSDFAIVSNAKCLTEGVDVPIIDSVYFVDPKTSLVDIVQACGRALRKGKDGSDVAHFIVPILLHPSDKDITKIEEGRFETLFNLVQALRDQDERLADVIDKLNLHKAKSSSKSSSGTSDFPLTLDLPTEFNLEAFSNEVELRILEANADPTVLENQEEYKVRKSSHAKIVKPLGDYGVESIFSNLASPTVDKFKDQDHLLSSIDIRFHNNNISHTERLGLIEKKDDGYVLTSLGKRYYRKEIDNEEVMKLALLKYNCGKDNELYPYRALLEILTNVNSLSHLEFLFAVYTLQDSTPESIDNAVHSILIIREKYPEIEKINKANQKVVLEDLNKFFGTNFTLAEAWGSTTVNNKFIYFRQHLSLFEGISTWKKELIITEESKSEIIDILDSSKP